MISYELGNENNRSTWQLMTLQKIYCDLSRFQKRRDGGYFNTGKP